MLALVGSFRAHCGSRSNLYEISACERVGRAVDDPIGLREAVQDFNLRTQVTPNSDLLQGDSPIGANNGDLRPVLAKQQRTCWDAHYIGWAGELEMNLGERARLEQAVGVVRLQFD